MKGVLTYVALAAALIFGPLLIGTLIWPLGGGGGLPGTLAFFGFGAGLVSWVFLVLIAMLGVGEAWTARGTYHVREHVLDMLPWAVAFIGIVAFFGTRPWS